MDKKMKMPFGKYRGKDFDSIPLSYLDWLNLEYGKIVDYAREKLRIIPASQRLKMAELKALLCGYEKSCPHDTNVMDLIDDIKLLFDIKKPTAQHHPAVIIRKKKIDMS